jgi:adenylylsulfate kinase
MVSSSTGAHGAAVIWFTGLSGSGKSTIAVALEERLRGMGVALERLDGDTVRDIFPSTGFDRASRIEHCRRIGYVAGLLEKHGIMVVCSFISPYKETRDAARAFCKDFVEVHVSTPLEECERRDVKGLYKKARTGEIGQFTGISDPYEPPENPALELDTTGISVDEAVERVLLFLKERA